MKKFVSLLTLLTFFIESISPGLARPLNRQDPSAEIVIPNRSSILTAKGKGRVDKQFSESPLSDEGLSSAFRIFGLERIRGIELLKKNLKTTNVQRFIANSIRNEPAKRFRDIFKFAKATSMKSFDSFCSRETTQNTYLDYFKTNNRQVYVEENCTQEGEPLENQATAYGLMDALARIQQKSLYIYTPTPEEDRLRLGHSFYLEGSRERINAICRGEHFNLLTLRDDERDQKLVLVKQEVGASSLEEEQEEEAEEEETDPRRPDTSLTPQVKVEEPSHSRQESEPERIQRPISLRYQRQISDAVNLAIPDRSSPLLVKGSQDTFNTYYTSGKENSCGFRIFGLERAEALELLANHINDPVVHKYIANTISTEPEDRFEQIFNLPRENITDLDGFLNEGSNQLAYLNFLKGDGSELEITKNCKKNGARLNMVRPEFGLTDADSCFRLINAIAHLQGKSLYIYQHSKTPGYLKFAHRFPAKRSQGRLNALYNGHHYSLLAPADDRQANERGHSHELQNLEILRQSLLREIEREEGASSHLRQPARIRPIQRSSQESSEEDSESNPERTNANDLALHRIKKEEPSTEIDEEEEEEVHRSFPEEDYVNFIDRKRGVRSLPGLNYAESLRQSYVHCLTQSEQLHTHQFDDKHIPYLFGIARLMLEFSYYPNPGARDAHARTLLKKLGGIIKLYKKSRESKLRRFANYARIYAGKTLVTLNKFHQAYKIFMNVGKQYTKTYYVDIAQMIMDGYRPDAMGNEDPTEYAKGLLAEAKSSSANPRETSRHVQRPRASASAKGKLLDTTLAHPAYVKASVTTYRKAHIENVIREREASARSAPSTSTRSQTSVRNDSRKRRAESDVTAARPIKRERMDLASSSDRSSRGTSLSSPLESGVPSPARGSSRKRAASPHKETPRSDKRRRISREETSESTDEETEEENFSGASSPQGSDEEESTTLSLMPNRKQQEFQRLLQLGYAKRNDGEKALQKALQLATEMKDMHLEVSALIGLGYCFSMNFNNINSLQYFKKALSKAKKIKNLPLLAKAHLGLGHHHDGNEKLHFAKVYELAIEIGDKKLQTEAYIGLGNASKDEEALKYFEKALQLAEELGNIFLQAQALMGAGRAGAQDWMQKFTTAYALADKLGDKKLKAQACIGRGNKLAANHKDEDARGYFEEAYGLAKESGGKKLQAQACIGLGNVFKGPEGLKYFEEALSIAKDIHDIALQAKARRGLGLAGAENRLEQFENTYALALRTGNKRLQAQACMDQGNVLGAKYKDKQALEYFEKALKLGEELNDLSLQAQAHLGAGSTRVSNRLERSQKAYQLAMENGGEKIKAQACICIGNILSAQHSDEESLKYFEEAYSLAEKIGDKILLAKACLGKGNSSRDQESQKWFEKALRIAEGINDEALQAKAHMRLGNTQSNNEQDHDQIAYTLAKKTGDKRLQAQASIGLGTCLSRNKNYAGAQQYFEEALNLAKDIKDKNIQAKAYNWLGSVLSTRRENNQASENYKSGLDLAKKINNIPLQIQAYMGLGNTETENEIEHFQTAYRLAKETGDKKQHPHTCVCLGNAFGANEKDKEALEYFEEGLKGAQEVDDRTLQTQAHIGIGRCRGENRLWHLNRGYELAKEIGEKKLQAQASIGLGNFFSANHEDKKALKYFEEGLKDAEEIGDLFLQTQAHIGIGNARGENEEEHYNMGYKLAKEIGDKKLQAQACIGLGNFFSAQKNDKEALKNYNEGLDLAKKINNIPLQIQVHLGAGNARVENQIERFETAYKLAKKIENKSLQAQACKGLGDGFSAQKQNEKALKYYEEAHLLNSFQARAEKTRTGIEKARTGIEKARAGIERVTRFLIQFGDGNCRAENRIKQLKTAYESAKKIENKSLQAQACIKLGYSFSEKRKNKKALKNYDELLNLAKEMDAIPLQIQAHIGAGFARAENRIEHFKTAYELAKKIGDKKQQAQACTGLGDDSSAHRQNEEALKYYEEALLLDSSPDINRKAAAGKARVERFLMKFGSKDTPSSRRGESTKDRQSKAPSDRRSDEQRTRFDTAGHAHKSESRKRTSDSSQGRASHERPVRQKNSREN